MRSLVQQGNAFARNVGLSAGAMYEQDQYIQGSFKVVANAALGNLYAEEKDMGSWKRSHRRDDLAGQHSG